MNLTSIVSSNSAVSNKILIRKLKITQIHIKNCPILTSIIGSITNSILAK